MLIRREPRRAGESCMRNSEFWSGRAGFIFANIASALGLGSIWKFPFEVGTNGGAGFVLFYLIGLATIVFPLMLAEFAIGRRGKSDAALSITVVAREARASTNWRWVGVLGVVTGFLILSFYSVIGGWALAYVVETAQVGIDGAVAQARFDDLLASPARMTAFHAVFMVMTALIVARGIAGGIEQASKFCSQSTSQSSMHASRSKHSDSASFLLV